jgi:uncharacterized membrane protein YdjX (TVP38/TMEM64 family)
VRRGLVLLAVVAVALVAGIVLPVREWIVTLLLHAREAGAPGAILFGGAFVGAALLLLPTAPLAIGAGWAFGGLAGALVAAAGTTLGATAAFEVGRRVGGDAVRRLLSRSRRLARFAAVLERAGFEAVLWLRVSPFVPFYLLNYAFGTTGMRASAFALATAIAVLPGCALWASLGSALAAPDLVHAGAASRGWGAAAAALALTLGSAVAARLRLPRVLARSERRSGAPDAAPRGRA